MDRAASLGSMWHYCTLKTISRTVANPSRQNWKGLCKLLRNLGGSLQNHQILDDLKVILKGFRYYPFNDLAGSMKDASVTYQVPEESLQDLSKIIECRIHEDLSKNYTYTPACMHHTYPPTHPPTYLPTYLPTYKHTYIRTYIHT